MPAVEKIKKNRVLQSLCHALAVALKSLLTHIFCLLPIRKYIMFESSGDFDGNAGILYSYLEKKGVLKEYKAVWVTKKKDHMLSGAITVPGKPSSIMEHLKRWYYESVSKYQLWDNVPIRKRRKGQINVNLSHGALPYKMIVPLTRFPDFTDFTVSPSPQCYQYKKYSWAVSDKVVPIFSPLPRNDVFLRSDWNELSKICGHRKYHKVIIWMPTFRAHLEGNRNDSTRDYPYGIPVIYKEEDLYSLNEQLKKLDVALLVKHHPRSIPYLSLPKLSNILFLCQFENEKIHFYKLLTQTDALISDYSSVVFDYMLLDRPIAWTLDDLDSYKLKFSMEDPLEFMPGNHVYCLKDLMDFIKQVSNGEDIFRKQRNDLKMDLGLKDFGYGCEKVASFLGLDGQDEPMQKS